MRISRRRLFTYGTLLGAWGMGAYTVGWWWFKARKGNTESLILSILHRHLAGLPVAEEDMERFARAIQPRFARRVRLAQLGMLGPLYERFDLIRFIPGSAETFRSFEDLIVSEFLLSSDFFSPHRSEREPIRYFGLRDPSRGVCGNPFARFEE